MLNHKSIAALAASASLLSGLAVATPALADSFSDSVKANAAYVNALNDKTKTPQELEQLKQTAIKEAQGHKKAEEFNATVKANKAYVDALEKGNATPELKATAEKTSKAHRENLIAEEKAQKENGNEGNGSLGYPLPAEGSATPATPETTPAAPETSAAPVAPASDETAAPEKVDADSKKDGKGLPQTGEADVAGLLTTLSALFFGAAGAVSLKKRRQVLEKFEHKKAQTQEKTRALTARVFFLVSFCVSAAKFQ